MERIEKEQTFWDNILNGVDIENIDLTGLDNLSSVYAPILKHIYQEDFFYGCIKDLRDKKVLSIGGGVDLPALYLASKGNKVLSSDVSLEAFRKTTYLAQKYNLQSFLTVRQLDWDKTILNEKFDVVINHASMHHLNFQNAASKIHNVLNEGGLWVALEPICLLNSVRWLHKNVPFLPPSHTYLVEGEEELRRTDLAVVNEMFKKVEFDYFALFSRESLAFVFDKMGWLRLLKKISTLDHSLSRKVPFLKNLCSYVVWAATK